MNSFKLSLEEKFGQMILLGLDTYEINDEIIELIKRYKIGGVVLYSKNYTSTQSMINFINKLKNININNTPLFIGIDQENGRVNRLPKDIERFYNPLKQAKTNNKKIVNMVNEISCYLMNSLGINMNFAPCVDVLHDEDNKVIGNRSYGTKKDVIEYGLSYMDSMHNHNIISVVKHFPNQALGGIDSHIITPKIRNKKLLNDDLEVYKEAIIKGADAIMIGHMKIEGMGAEAIINKKIIDKYLIKKLNYQGLIVTDDIKMSLLRFRLKSNIIKSINAGCNVIMVKYKKGETLSIYKDLYKKVKNYEIDPEKVYNSYKKIIMIKNKYNLTNEEFRPKLNLELINKKILEVNNAMDRVSL